MNRYDGARHRRGEMAAAVLLTFGMQQGIDEPEAMHRAGEENVTLVAERHHVTDDALAVEHKAQPFLRPAYTDAIIAAFDSDRDPALGKRKSHIVLHVVGAESERYGVRGAVEPPGIDPIPWRIRIPRLFRLGKRSVDHA